MFLLSTTLRNVCEMQEWQGFVKSVSDKFKHETEKILEEIENLKKETKQIEDKVHYISVNQLERPKFNSLEDKLTEILSLLKDESETLVQPPTHRSVIIFED